MKILVRMPNWIGDFIMATPILEDLKKKYPQANLTVLCLRELTDLLEKNPWVDNILSISKKPRFFPKGLIRNLRKGAYTMGILLTNSFSSAWLFWIGGVKCRIGFYKVSRSLFLSKKIPFPKDKEKQHLTTTYKTLIQSSSSTKPSLFISPKERALGKTYIGMHPGAAYGEAKRWPQERFSQVIQRLLDDIPQVNIIVFGHAKEKPLVNNICKPFPKQVSNLSGKTTLKELCQQIARLDAFLTNDSGPMHIAASLQVPLVALFGSTNPLVTAPYKWGKILYKKAFCSPCYKKVCPIDFRCMKQIGVDEVVKEVKKALLVRIKQQQKPFSFKGALPPPFSIQSFRSNKTFGTILLAAGKGKRLGLSSPKGLLTIQGLSLYELLLRKIEGLCAILTSPLTHKATKQFLLEKRFFSIDLFQERCLPSLSSPYEEMPEGNGALFTSFYTSPIWEKWRHVEEIRVLPIDNPLAYPLPGSDCELTVLAIKKTDETESVGSLIEKGKKLYVCEYFHLPKQEQKRWTLAYSGLFSCKKSFFEKAALAKLPWHLVQKKEQKHFEKLLFDAFPLASSYKILLQNRKECFSPIKTKEDLIHFKEKSQQKSKPLSP